MLGGLLISIFAGSLLGVIALLAGFGFWWSLLIYSTSGVCIFLVVAGCAVLRKTNVAGHDRKTSSIDPNPDTGMHTARAPVLVPMQQVRGIVATEARRAN